MRITASLRIAVAILVVLTTVAAVASEGVVTVNISKPMQLNGKQISEGSYKVSWTGADDKLQVKFMSGKKEIATAGAKMVEMQVAAPYTAVVYQNGKILQIDMAGKKTALVFSE